MDGKETPFEHLFSPIEIRGIRIRNRIVFTAHHTGLAEHGLVTEALIRYHERRAEGGVGLIVLECQGVSRSAVTNDHFMQIFRDEAVDGLKRLTGAVKDRGAAVFVQLWHPGRQSSSSTSLTPMLAPSSLPCFAMREPPKEMEMEEIAGLVADFASAARRARHAGVDGLEIHCTHGYLLQQFLSPYSNRRTDGYGGDFEGRIRLLLEVIDAVRAEAGDETVVGVRLCADELLGSAGITPDYSKKVAERITQTKKIDYLSVTCGNYTTFFTVAPPMNFPLGCFVHYAEAIKGVTTLPVITAGRINNPALGNEIVGKGQADMVAMTRALICDPDLPVKAQSGRGHLIRKCMACNRGCIGRLRFNLHVSCVQNPEAGRETTIAVAPAVVQSKGGRRVLVIGGGIAGMKAAETAALRGHSVTLVEKDRDLGGKLNLVARTPGRDGLLEAVEYLKASVESLGVGIRPSSEGTLPLVDAEDPDWVIVATGSIPSKFVQPPYPKFAGIDSDRVWTWEDVYRNGSLMTGTNIAVYSLDPYHKGLYVARMLVEHGKKPYIIEPYESLLFNLGEGVSSYFTLADVLQMGGEVLNFSMIDEVRDGVAVIRNVINFTTKEIPCDGVVFAGYDRPRDSLYFELKAKRKNVLRVGDAVVPNQIDHAVLSGYQAGNLIV